MTGSLIFDPVLPVWIIACLGAVALAALALAVWRGLSGWALRSLGAAVILAALLGPTLSREDREDLSDIAIIVEDDSASQHLGDRAEMTAGAADALEARLAARGVEVRRTRVGDGADDSGTELMTALSEALAAEPQGRIAGMFLLSDGRLHDLERAPQLPAPLHLLHTGRSTDWDRRLIVEGAPAFAILDEEITLTLRIEDSGAAPEDVAEVPLAISIDGDAPLRFTVPVGRDVELPLALPHGGRNVLEFTTPEAGGELTARNNSALVQINGVRDRLRVLLVSGEPHAGGRTWRNLLKSDSSVDLVHFTILRPPDKQDGIPVDELSLIAFPTRELFMEKIDDFDLIIFDRYKRRGILPIDYLLNVVDYVQKGGAVLFAAGPDFAGASSLYRSPLGAIVPARPTSLVVDEPYRPKVTDLGQKHPVTAGLEGAQEGEWGRWLRQIEVETDDGEVVMTGAGDHPLLILDRKGEGRVALLASDQAWLWSRGYERGGPQLELLRRLAHWMMKEPELEEEALWAEATGQRMRIIHRTLADSSADVTITAPDGSEVTLPLEEVAPGRFEARYDGPQTGLYRLASGDKAAVIGLGPASPVEFEQTISSGEALAPLIDGANGGILAIEDGMPAIRTVREGRPAAGWNWLGITPRGAYVTKGVTQTALLPPWLVLALIAALVTGAWLREGRR